MDSQDPLSSKRMGIMYMKIIHCSKESTNFANELLSEKKFKHSVLN
jgi:hypothetical protein